MGKRIWIVNYYTGRPGSISNTRYLEFDTNFLMAGHDVITFNSSRSAKVDFKGKFEEKWYGQYHYIHVNVPKNDGILRRVWSIFFFAMRIYFYRNHFPKPDVILHNVHTPFDYPVYWAAKRLKAKYIAEAWDMWPEDLVTFGFLKANSPIMKFAYKVERMLYDNADKVVFTFEGGPDYLKEKGWTTDSG